MLDPVVLLLKLGARPNRDDKAGNTPLHYAAQSGSLEVVRQLVDCKARVDTANLEGLLPLDVARWDLLKPYQVDTFQRLLTPPVVAEAPVEQQTEPESDDALPSESHQAELTQAELRHVRNSFEQFVGQVTHAQDNKEDFSEHFKDFAGVVFEREANKLHNAERAQRRLGPGRYSDYVCVCVCVAA